jgi:hypothetical protein
MELHAIILRAATVFTASDNLRLQGNRFCNLQFILTVSALISGTSSQFASSV